MNPGDYRVEPAAVGSLRPHVDSVMWEDRTATTVLAVLPALPRGGSRHDQPTYQVVTVAGTAVIPPKADGSPGTLDRIVPVDPAT